MRQLPGGACASSQLAAGPSSRAGGAADVIRGGEPSHGDTGNGAEVAAQPVVQTYKGVQLHLSAYNQTGYRGVYRMGARFQAQAKVGNADGRLCTIGTFDTAVEAAVRRANSPRPPPSLAMRRRV